MDPLTGSAIFGFGRWLVTSRIGRALLLTVLGLLLATALGLALWWAYSTVWQRGYDAAADEGATALRTLQAQVEADRQASEREARAKEAEQRTALDDVAAKYEQEKADAQAAADSTIADLRAGTVRLQRRWQGCETAARVPIAPAGAGEPDGGTADRIESAGRIVRAAAECDAHVRGLQSAIRALTGQP